MRTLLTAAYNSCGNTDNNVASIGLHLTPQVVRLIRNASGLIRSGAAGDARNISGLELITLNVFIHPLTCEEALELPGSVFIGPQHETSTALFPSELLPDESGDASGLQWGEHTTSATYLKVDENHLWLIACQRRSSDRYVSDHLNLEHLYAALSSADDDSTQTPAPSDL